MRDWKRVLHGLPPHLLAWIWSVLLLLQMGLAFFVFNEPRLPGLRVAGWAIWALGTAFAILPIFTLRTRGRVPEGKSYMETTALVGTGIYAIVRHPQGGTAGILLSLALALIGQHWLLAVLAAVGMVLIYIDTFKADEACILFASGVYGLVELIRNWKTQTTETREEPLLQREATGQKRVAQKSGGNSHAVLADRRR
jgi:protein-S-isoprenylcysteine O-methyltransferase Ste14